MSEGFAYFGATMSNNILHVLQEHSSVIQEKTGKTDLSAVTTCHPLKKGLAKILHQL